MYHRDLIHSGFIPVDVKSVSKDWTSQKLDGAIYAEPLIVGGKVYVATENNSIYSLYAQNGSINWRVHIGQPVAGDSLPCGNINPSGITGTPAIDNSSRILYAVAFLSSSSQPSSPRHVLIGLNIDSGKVIVQRNIDPAGMDPSVHQQRAALTIANGMVYIPFGGLWGDCGNYNGWVVGVPTNDTGSGIKPPVVTYKVPTDREGGFWAPPGAAVDTNGYLYVASGNGASVISYDHGNSVIKLSSSLNEVGSFAPSDWAILNAQDADLGSVSPAIVGPKLLFQIGKAGVGYLVNADSLGGLGGELYRGKVCDGAYGGTAYAAPYLFVPCTDGLYVLRMNNDSFSIVWHTQQQFYAGPPIVTGNMVWAIDVSGGTIHAFDLRNGNQLFTANLGSVPHFSTPSSGYGRVFAVSDNDRITSFDLS
jgi:outer membrane protein assembly factor BamB